jgi:hypothetical protein
MSNNEIRPDANVAAQGWANTYERGVQGDLNAQAAINGIVDAWRHATPGSGWSNQIAQIMRDMQRIDPAAAQAFNHGLVHSDGSISFNTTQPPRGK